MSISADLPKWLELWRTRLHAAHFPHQHTSLVRFWLLLTAIAVNEKGALSAGDNGPSTAAHPLEHLVYTQGATGSNPVAPT
jgi:hypothetical protein